MSLGSQIKDVKKQFGKIVDEGSGFFEKATPDIHQKRLIVCYNCPFLLEKTKRCDECGCFVHEKSALKSQFCPKNKW